ncbi:OFA family MFS transporter [Rubeoparvulum massiliense]|uniref:OFA family MFS transporter n=1 Tax=Rubeoparvulum massiliense TaxID=1631346 RepID=UPI00065E8B4F|nr:OFA family MFS transporter [Rubeoparvulum massiliense]
MNINNKWMRGAVPALLLHCSIGSVYAWSLFVLPISEYIGKPASSVQFAFSLAIFFLGMSAAFGGGMVEKNIKRSSLLAVFCFCSGLLIAALAMKLKSLPLLYLGYGCMMGIGLGIGYLTPVKTLMMWFADKKGLATGIAIMGFGLAATIASPIITFLTSNFSLQNTFIIMACIYFVPMFLGHLLIKKPYDDHSAEEENLNIKALFTNKTVIFIWLMFYLNIHCGLSLISTAAPLMAEQGITVGVAATVVAVMGIFNAGGRLVFATASDYVKDRIIMYRIVFVLSIIGVLGGIFLGVKMGVLGVLIATLFIVCSGYGAGFSCLPVLLSDRFSMGVISRIHGFCLSAWGIAGLTGNSMASFIHDQTGNYTSVLYVLVFIYALAFFFSTKVPAALRKVEKKAA